MTATLAPPPLRPFWKAIIWLSHIFSALACAGLAVMIVAVCADVTLRAMGVSVKGAYDIVRIAGVVTIGCALPVTTAAKGHVAIEYFFHKLNRTGRVLVDSAMRLLMIASFLAAAAACLRHGLRFLRSGSVTDTIELPVFWVPWLVATALLLCAVIVVFHLLHPGRELMRS